MLRYPINIPRTCALLAGAGGRITKEDVATHLSAPAPVAAPATAAQPVALSLAVGERIEKRVPMTRLRAKVANVYASLANTAI